MHHRHVNGYDMAYLALGDGPPLVCVHGAECVAVGDIDGALALFSEFLDGAGT